MFTALWLMYRIYFLTAMTPALGGRDWTLEMPKALMSISVRSQP